MSDPASPAPRPTHNRRPFVLTMIILASLLFIATETLLYFRWSSVREPSSVLVVNAGERLRGAQIEVDGLMLPQPLKATVGEQGRFSIPFYVDPGNYQVRVLIDHDVQFRGAVSISRPRSGVQMDLTHVVPTTTPSTRPAEPAF